MRYLIYFLLLLNLHAFDSPYSNNDFKDILNKSKLQAPLSKFDPRWSVHYGKFENFSNRYFYLSDSKYMVFEMCGKKRRSELRVKNIWKVSTKTPKILYAEVKIFPLNTEREFTFLQIHADSTLKNSPVINKPLLRITWIKELHNIRDHIWAIIRNSSDVREQKYLKVDLGKREDGFTKFKIAVHNSRLYIFVNGFKKIDMDIKYWKNFYNYFKAGVYLQSKGCAKVLFKKIIIKDKNEY